MPQEQAAIITTLATKKHQLAGHLILRLGSWITWPQYPLVVLCLVALSMPSRAWAKHPLYDIPDTIPSRPHWQAMNWAKTRNTLAFTRFANATLPYWLTEERTISLHNGSVRVPLIDASQWWLQVDLLPLTAQGDMNDDGYADMLLFLERRVIDTDGTLSTSTYDMLLLFGWENGTYTPATGLVFDTGLTPQSATVQHGNLQINLKTAEQAQHPCCEEFVHDISFRLGATGLETVAAPRPTQSLAARHMADHRAVRLRPVASTFQAEDILWQRVLLPVPLPPTRVNFGNLLSSLGIVPLWLQHAAEGGTALLSHPWPYRPRIAWPDNPQEILMENRTVYLTFDDGPHKIKTPTILDLLAEYDAKATFFVLGSLADQYPNLIKRMLDEGHSVANHSYSHLLIHKVPLEIVEADLDATRNAIGAQGQGDCFRPPYGIRAPHVLAHLNSLGYRIIYWDVDTRDWEKRDAATIAQRALQNIRHNSIVLMHDGGGSSQATIDALAEILTELNQQGYHFEPLCQ